MAQMDVTIKSVNERLLMSLGRHDHAEKRMKALEARLVDLTLQADGLEKHNAALTSHNAAHKKRIKMLEGRVDDLEAQLSGMDDAVKVLGRRTEETLDNLHYLVLNEN